MTYGVPSAAGVSRQPGQAGGAPRQPGWAAADAETDFRVPREPQSPMGRVPPQAYTVRKVDIERVEFMVQKAKKQLKMLSAPSVTEFRFVRRTPAPEHRAN